jgi:hypothetical protein
MVRGDIIGGLKIALSRGQKLQEAMQSFYNAGYKKQDIIDAARTLKTQGFVPKVAKQPLPDVSKIGPSKSPIKTSPLVPSKTNVPLATPDQQKSYTKNPSPSTLSPAKPLSKTVPPVQPSVIPKQTVSAYAQPEKKKIDFMTILLAVILLLLIGVLVGVFFFKDSIISFLNSILE